MVDDGVDPVYQVAVPFNTYTSGNATNNIGIEQLKKVVSPVLVVSVLEFWNVAIADAGVENVTKNTEG